MKPLVRPVLKPAGAPLNSKAPAHKQRMCDHVGESLLSSVDSHCLAIADGDARQFYSRA